MAKGTQVICESVFKSVDKKERKKEFTRRWIVLVNQREKDEGYNSAG